MKKSNPNAQLNSSKEFSNNSAPFLALLFLFVLSACSDSKSDAESNMRKDALPSEGCSAAWAAEPAREFVNLLVEATKSGLETWEGYDLSDGAYVLNAGKSTTGKECLGLWKGGRALDFTTLSEAPKLATPLYGYYLNYGELSANANTAFLAAFDQPDSVRLWIEGNNIQTAVVMPVEFPDFPFKLPAITKTQLAIHEAFHVEVQLRYWNSAKGSWPVWDIQPDRPGLQACYNENDLVKEAIKEEQQILSELIEALLDADKPKASLLANSFLKTRANRYEMLRDVKVKQHDGTFGSCAISEAMMEQEEGGADYASWTKLYELGLATREKLITRYRAIQAEPFYLTGAMQLHAISLMQPDNMEEIIREISQSETPEEGSITTIFERVFNEYAQ